MDAPRELSSDLSGRDQFIPARKVDVLKALVERGALGGEPEREMFQQFCRLLGAIYHYQYFDQLERLRNDYYYFSPEIDNHPRADAATIERTYRDLVDALTVVLRGANFVEIPRDELARAHREHVLLRVNIKASVESYREVRFFRRGHHTETIEISEWFGWRKRSAEVVVYDDVVLLAAAKNVTGQPTERKHRGRRPKVRPGSILLKYFRNIASADLEALFPDVRVVMGLRDQLLLGVPALIGGVPILLKLASTLTVFFVVAGFYLGLSSAVRDADVAGALAAVSGLIALGGFCITQWVRFQRQSLLHQKTLSDNIYYRNVNNNAGIFGYIIGEAEEQECKEAFLAYYFLLTAADQPSEDALDRRIETWLRQTFGSDIDFECNDALAKLDKLGVLRRDGGTLAVLPLNDALRQLDRVWDGFFEVSGVAQPVRV
jgi:hypothetical protein